MCIAWSAAVDIRLAAPLCATVLLGIGGCGSSSATPTCVAVPQTIPNDSLVTNGTRLAVPIGAIVYAVLVETENYMSKPGFPWLTPTTSDRLVLAPVRLCQRTGASSLPVSVTGFRALHQGTATVTARLAPGWPGSFKTGPEPSRGTVTVK